MKKKLLGIFVCMLLMGTGVLAVNSASACTGFTASEGENVLAGSNEDWCDPDFNIRFLPAKYGKYGRMFAEFKWPLSWNPNWMAPFMGVNDQGLFYDSFKTPYNEILNNGEKPLIFLLDHYRCSLQAYILSVCSTVQDVIDIIYDYDIISAGLEGDQLFYVDRNGDSLIIAGDDIIYKEGDYQVVTNFIQTKPELGGYPCWRYDTAVSMLENMNELSVDYFRDICDATHVENVSHPTTYSQVSDLKNGIIYFYHFGDYDNVLTIDLQEELKKGKHVWLDVASLFEPVDNQPPEKPDPPTGEVSGAVKTEYVYKVDDVEDPDNTISEIYYQFDWGDGTFSTWKNRYWVIGGEMTHSWNRQGNYDVRVKAKDIYGAESDWSNPLTVTMPRNKPFNFNFPILSWLFERFPNAFPILRHILGL
jgi:choloylglycine hydrolase